MPEGGDTEFMGVVVSLKKLQEVCLRVMKRGGRDLELREGGVQPTHCGLTHQLCSSSVGTERDRHSGLRPFADPLTVPTHGVGILTPPSPPTRIHYKSSQLS